MTKEIIVINCYGEKEFEIDGTSFNSREQLEMYCRKRCTDGPKPERIYMYFRGIPIKTMEGIANWKRKTLDIIISK